MVDTRRDRDERAYTDAVLQQLAHERPCFEGPLASVYFGGGTPSEAQPGELLRIMQALHVPEGVEVTAEVNPGTLAPEQLRALSGLGVNRISLGVQSFVGRSAAKLGRPHNTAESLSVLRQALSMAFRSVSIDLMFGMREQTLVDLDADLDVVLEHRPPHVSLYGLTIEPETAFARRKRRAMPDTAWRRRYDRIQTRLMAAGYDHYEVSNFALPGHQSVHNRRYWQGDWWAGLGAGAHGFRPGGVRTLALGTVDAYMGSPLPQPEIPTRRELAAELIGAAIRTAEGLKLSRLETLTGLRVAPPRILTDSGALRQEGDVLRITEASFALADFVASRLCEGLRGEG